MTPLKSAIILFLIMIIAELSSLNTEGKGLNENPFFVQLPIGKMEFQTRGKWKWSDSCHSLKVPCYQGLFQSQEKPIPEGTAYLFAAPLTDLQTPTKISDLCRVIYTHHEKLTQSGPVEIKPNTFQIHQNSKGQPYCSWNQGGQWTYLWKTEKTMVSISFGALNEANSTQFFKEVKKFTSEVSFHEK